MQQTTASSRPATIQIDDIIAVCRSATQNQYSARELHTTVCLICFKINLELYFICFERMQQLN
jgi:hypothetical protein